MRVDTGEYNTFFCDNSSCGEEILDPPYMIEGRFTHHFCSVDCASKWLQRPLLAVVNGARVLP